MGEETVSGFPEASTGRGGRLEGVEEERMVSTFVVKDLEGKLSDEESKLRKKKKVKDLESSALYPVLTALKWDPDTDSCPANSPRQPANNVPPPDQQPPPAARREQSPDSTDRTANPRHDQRTPVPAPPPSPSPPNKGCHQNRLVHRLSLILTLPLRQPSLCFIVAVINSTFAVHCWLT
ncbi:hypothetical protein GJAV_G00153500 [Gymnothorax javanicus]|nr:hypothetical protein GJAV_G00153500 [Gymnothorax javanicus]